MLKRYRFMKKNEQEMIAMADTETRSGLNKMQEENLQNELEIEKEANESCCSSETGRKKERSDAERKSLVHRLNRIEGQIRGVRRMVENDDYCVDILTQVSAASCALNSFTKELLATHIKGCVTDDIKEGHEEKVDELVKLIQKLLK